MSSAELSVVTKTLQLLLYWEGDAHLGPIWTLGSAIYCGDCKVFCPVSHIRPVTARPASKLQICQNLAPLPICVKMFHSVCYFVATVIRVVCTQSDMCRLIHAHILHNIGTLVVRKNFF